MSKKANRLFRKVMAQGTITKGGAGGSQITLPTAVVSQLCELKSAQRKTDRRIKRLAAAAETLLMPSYQQTRPRPAADIQGRHFRNLNGHDFGRVVRDAEIPQWHPER